MSLVNFTLGLNTKIDAINYVLSAIGAASISSEEEIEEDIDASAASSLIDDISQQVQTNNGKGWWFNRENFHNLIPNPTTGQVTVPKNTLSCYLKRRQGNPTPIALRGVKLFDSEESGYDMRRFVDSNGVIPCMLVVTLPYEEVPATVKQTVADFGRFWIVSNFEGDNNKMGPLKQAAEASLISLKAEDASQRKRNMFDNSTVANALYRAGGFNNN